MNIKFENLHTLVSCEYPSEPCALLKSASCQLPQPALPTRPVVLSKPLGWGLCSVGPAKSENGGRLSKIFIAFSEADADIWDTQVVTRASCRDRFKNQSSLGSFNTRFGKKRFI